MTLLQINEQFKTVTDAVAGLNGYSFGMPSDRTRSQTYDEPGEDQTSLYPRVFWVVPDFTHFIATRKDQYECVVFFDDLLGYDDDGEANLMTQAEKWSMIAEYAERWFKEMQTNKTTGKIIGDVRIELNTFGLKQRLIYARASFTFGTNATC